MQRTLSALGGGGGSTSPIYRRNIVQGVISDMNKNMNTGIRIKKNL